MSLLNDADRSNSSGFRVMPQFVEDIFDLEIRNDYSRLKQEKLLDLLEHTQELLENFTDLREQGHFSKALVFFIVGSFYVYLIIPLSSQFQATNKSYEIYTEIKKLYENYPDMESITGSIKNWVQEYIVKDDTSRKCENYMPEITHYTKYLNANSISEWSDIPRKASVITPTKFGSNHDQHCYGNESLWIPQDFELASQIDTQLPVLIPPILPQKISIEPVSQGTITQSKSLRDYHNLTPRHIDQIHEKPLKIEYGYGAKSNTRKKSPNSTANNENPKHHAPLSTVGLKNMGNTCYINSVMQCLFSTGVFSDLFLSRKYKRYVDASYREGPRLSACISYLFESLVISAGSITPSEFLTVCSYLFPNFRIPNEQQDTQEFLMLLLDRLHDELSNQEEVAEQFYDLLLYDEKTLKVEGKKYKEWFEKSRINNKISPIDYIFQGQVEDLLRCNRCGETSYNYSSFYILSLAIPRPSSTVFKTGRVKLEDCLELYLKDEKLKADNAWKCNTCYNHLRSHDPLRQNKATFLSMHKKSSRKPLHHTATSNNLASYTEATGIKEKRLKNTTTKITNFISLPPILIIHLSRFFNKSSSKNSMPITYPLELNIMLKNSEKVKYRLYAIVDHTGNASSGHYTSIIKTAPSFEPDDKRKNWLHCDDEFIKPDIKHNNARRSGLKITSKHAYLLFYERAS